MIVFIFQQFIIKGKTGMLEDSQTKDVILQLASSNRSANSDPTLPTLSSPRLFPDGPGPVQAVRHLFPHHLPVKPHFPRGPPVGHGIHGDMKEDDDL